MCFLQPDPYALERSRIIVSSRCLRLIQLRPRSRGGQVFGESQEKHWAVCLGQTAHGTANDGGLFPPKIQVITALAAANEVGGDLHQPRPNAGGVPKLLQRLIRLDETVASRFRLIHERGARQAKKGRFVAGGVGPANRNSRFFPAPCSSGPSSLGSAFGGTPTFLHPQM